MREEMESLNPLDLSPAGPLHSRQRYFREFQQFGQNIANNIYRYIRTKFVKNIAKNTVKQCFGAILTFSELKLSGTLPLSMSDFQWKYMLRKYLLR